MAHQIGNSVVTNWVDKRRTNPDPNTHTTIGTATFTGNGAGSTTTIVGANAAPGVDDTNVVRRGEKFRLFTAAGVLKEEKVFTITGVAVAASTTVTFSPAALVATAATDVARLVGLFSYGDEQNLDVRLLALGFTQAQINVMTQNDKVFAVRTRDDPGSM